MFFEIQITRAKSENSFENFSIYHMDANTPISDVKFLISLSIGVPESKQRISYNQETLGNDKKLSDYAILSYTNFLLEIMEEINEIETDLITAEEID